MTFFIITFIIAAAQIEGYSLWLRLKQEHDYWQAVDWQLKMPKRESFLAELWSVRK